jgi:hypothetical protein
LPDQQIEDDTTRATAHLPGLEIEIVHRRSPGAEVEQVSINLQLVPSFEAFGRFVETNKPVCALGAGCAVGAISLARRRERPDGAPERRAEA